MEAGVAEIKAHPFFGDIDWEKLYMKQIQPPFIPGVSDTDDVSNVDPEFLAEVPADTPLENHALMQQFQDESNFDNFTYVNENNNLTMVGSQAGRLSHLDSSEINKSTT